MNKRDKQHRYIAAATIAIAGVVGSFGLTPTANAAELAPEGIVDDDRSKGTSGGSCKDYWWNGRGDCDWFIKLCADAGGTPHALHQYDDWGGSTTYTCHFGGR